MSLVIVGFAGRPVSRAAGVKAPLVFNTESRCYSVFQGNAPTSLWNESEIVAFEGQALLTRISRHTPYGDGAVVVYAHCSFVAPPSDVDEASYALPAMVLPVGELVLEPKTESYVGTLPVEGASALLDRWGRALLDAARTELNDIRASQKTRAAAAWRDVLRARYATAGRGDSSAQALRREAVILGWTALKLTGENDKNFREDTALDFQPNELDVLHDASSKLLRELPAPRRSGSHLIRRDRSVPPYRYQEDSP